MNLDEALTGVTAIGLDTAPLIYFIEHHPAYADKVREIIQRVDVGQIAAFSSVVTLTEVLILPKRLKNKQLETQYRDLLTHSRNFSLVPIDAVIAEKAADLRARYPLRTPDALQIAAALEAGCQAFLTNDAKLKNIQELRAIVLEELES